MSVATRRAIYGKLAADSTLTGMLGDPPDPYAQSIYYQVAPQGAEFPYVIFSKSAGTPTYALGGDAFDSEIWQVKVVARGKPGSDQVNEAETIATRLDTLLTDGTLSIAGRIQLYLRRESDLDYPEVLDGVVYRHAGADFRLVSQSS